MDGEKDQMDYLLKSQTSRRFMELKKVVMFKEHLIDSEWLTYLWVFGVSLWGGLVSFFERKNEPFSWVRLFAHLLSSSFAGMMTFYICQYGHIAEPLTGALCGVAAHMGTPALLRMKIIKQFLEKEKVGE